MATLHFAEIKRVKHNTKIEFIFIFKPGTSERTVKFSVRQFQNIPETQNGSFRFFDKYSPLGQD